MKRTIILGLTVAAIAAINAYASEARSIKRLMEDVVSRSTGSETLLRNDRLTDARAYKGKTKIKALSEEGRKGYALFENFDGWDGTTKNWIPDGWNVEHNGTCARSESWVPYRPGAYEAPPSDGEYCYSITYSEKTQDEWLISPQFIPAEGMELSYFMLLDPIWMYDTANLDWLKKEYIGDKITLYTLQILIQEEGKEWQLLRDYAEEYMDWTARELGSISNPKSLTKQTVDLHEYTDKNVRIAFRYLGRDGNNMTIDAIGIGYPPIDDVWYMEPSNSLYWGLSRDASFSNLPADIAIYPANTPITWINMTDEDVDFSWEYRDPEGSGLLVSEERDALSMSYGPSKPGNIPSLYESPTLTATADRRVDGTYTSPVEFFQAGGEASLTTPEGRQDFTLFQFPIVNQDISFTGVMDPAQGAFNVPVFGYNEFSDVYWLNYSLNGESALESDYSHLIGIGNLFFPSSDAPLMVKGMSIYGWGLIGQDAELTATIYALDSELHSDYDTFQTVARASIKGSDIQYLDNMGMKDYMYLPFRFDEPATVQASEEHPAFLFMLEGFRSEHVEHFAPLQSYHPIKNGIPSGYILNEICLQGHVDMEPYKSLKSMRYVEEGVYKDINGSFAIGLDAEYPVDENEVKEIESQYTAAPDISGVYDVSGNKVASTNQPGIYIIRYSDGTVKKKIKD